MSIPLDWRDVARYEVGILALAAFTSAVFLWTSGWLTATKTFFLFFFVPQPFVLYAFKDVFFKPKGDADAAKEDD
ncbi:MAG TPA: hypothetical protein VFF71_02815 [Luteimonas sp.]|nr:hypothetical protein [Luteimonas sp.]